MWNVGKTARKTVKRKAVARACAGLLLQALLVLLEQSIKLVKLPGVEGFSMTRSIQRLRRIAGNYLFHNLGQVL